MKQEELIAISGIVDDLKANPLSRSQRLLALSIGALKSMVSRRPKDKKPVYDVAIVGTGPAGLSAALNLRIHEKNASIFVSGLVIIRL